MSACKTEGIAYSPSHIQRALENTAKTMPNLSFPQQGWGMIQVDKAFEYLKACKDLDYNDVFYDVRVDSRSTGSYCSPRGIYMRQPDETSVGQTFVVSVNPQFPRDDDVGDDNRSIDRIKSQRSKIDFEVKFNVQCDGSPSWVTVPDHFMLMNNGRNFKVSVDPTLLPPGLHTTKVCGFDADHPERGVVWYLPITVAKPLDEERIIELGELEVRLAIHFTLTLVAWFLTHCRLTDSDLLLFFPVSTSRGQAILCSASPRCYVDGYYCQR